MSLDQNLQDFILGNFNSIPEEVIDVIIAQIDRTALLSLCQTNTDFSSYCEKEGLFDRLTLENMNHETPLGGYYRTLAEQANLIKRGFGTVYHFTYEDGEISDIGFGYHHDIPELQNANYFAAEIDIKGLPPKSGTVVWLLVNTRYINPIAYPQVFQTHKAAFSASKASKKGGIRAGEVGAVAAPGEIIFEITLP
jgi:hypothetical protein